MNIKIPSHRLTPRRAFTLVELLVVIAIIGVLVALLLPAVQQARESGRRVQCQNNFKQLALALHGYHDSMKILPPAQQLNEGIDTYSNTTLHRPNWIIRVLPYMEQQTIYDSFNFNVPISDATNEKARSVRIGTLLCPTDPNSTKSPFAGNSAAEGGNWARGNYGANAGGGDPNVALSRPRGTAWHAWHDVNCRGVMHVNNSLTFAQIGDGLTNTLLLGELRVGMMNLDRRGTWALGTAGASILMTMGYAGNAKGVNYCQDDHSDDIAGCTSVQSALGPRLWRTECMGCWSGNRSWQAGVRSKHPGGANGALCDGSVRFLSNTIERAAYPSVWDNLITSMNGQATGDF